MLKDLRELEKDINFIKLELEKNLSNEDKNLLLTLMDLQNIKQKRLWDLAYIRIDKDKKCAYKLISELENEEDFFIGGVSNMLFINTTNPLKKKAINRVLNINDDKLKEVLNIIDILNAPEIKADDIRKVKFLVWGCISKKNNSKENHIKSTYDQEERLNYLSTLVEVLDNIDNK